MLRYDKQPKYDSIVLLVAVVCMLLIKLGV